VVSVQQDAISNCGHLDGRDIVTCEMQARVESSRNISTDATRNCVAKFCYFCEVVECMCQHGYAWRGQGCSLVDH
jgi:hypothetical protein